MARRCGRHPRSIHNRILINQFRPRRCVPKSKDCCEPQRRQALASYDSRWFCGSGFEVSVHSLIMSFAQRLLLAIGFISLAYAGGTVAYAELFQRYESWKFEPKTEAIELTNTESAVVAEPVDLNEGDSIGKLEIP